MATACVDCGVPYLVFDRVTLVWRPHDGTTTNGQSCPSNRLSVRRTVPVATGAGPRASNHWDLVGFGRLSLFRMEPTSLLLRDRSWSWTPRRLYSPRDRLSCTTSTSQSHMRISCASRWIDASKEFGYQKNALGFRIRRPWRPTNHCRMHHDGVVACMCVRGNRHEIQYMRDRPFRARSPTLPKIQYCADRMATDRWHTYGHV